MESKCIWLWLLDNCDCAGIIEPDMDLAAFQIGATKPLVSPYEALGDRVQKHGAKLFIPKFIAYQYGAELNLANTAHRGVIRRLELAKIPCPVSIVDKNNKTPSKPLQSPLQGAQDKDKDKDKETVTDKEDNNELCVIESPFLDSPPEAAKTMQQLMSEINKLRPSWGKLSMWTRSEMEQLRGGTASQMQSLVDDDWKILKAYFESTQEGYFRPDNRSKFCESFSGIWTACERWKKATGYRAPNSRDSLYYGS